MNPEKEMEYYEDTTLKNDGELGELNREENDANDLEEFVAKEEESTSTKPNEMIKEIVENFSEMTLWCEVHKELKNEKMAPINEVDECIFQLNKELEAIIVKKKEKNIKKVSVEDYVPKLLIEHNYRFLGTDGGGNYPSFCSSMSQAEL